MDSLGSRKGWAIRELVRKAGARGVVPAALQPRPQPDEQVIDMLKHLLRKAQERSSEHACDRIGQLLNTFSPEVCANYLANSGYLINAN